MHHNSNPRTTEEESGIRVRLEIKKIYYAKILSHHTQHFVFPSHSNGLSTLQGLQQELTQQFCHSDEAIIIDSNSNWKALAS